MLLSNVLRGATLSGDPLTWQFQVLWFLHFLTIPLLLSLMLLLLVVAPTRDAYASMKVRAGAPACALACLVSVAATRSLLKVCPPFAQNA